MRKIIAFMLVVSLSISAIAIPSAFAACSHENVNHSYKIYQNHGSMGHSSLTICKCMSCGATLPCHPHPGQTPPTPHTWKVRKTTYRNNGSNHTVTSYLSCVCGASSSQTETVAHAFKYVSDNHGSGTIHHFHYRCACGQTRTDSIYCPGNPCPKSLMRMMRYQFDKK